MSSGAKYIHIYMFESSRLILIVLSNVAHYNKSFPSYTNICLLHS